MKRVIVFRYAKIPTIGHRARIAAYFCEKRVIRHSQLENMKSGEEEREVSHFIYASVCARVCVRKRKRERS